jgi:hypothetical protein
MLWTVTPQAGSRIRYTDRSLAILMRSLVELDGKLLSSKVIGNESLSSRSKFFKVLVELPVDKKQEFETMSGFKLKYPNDQQLVG